MVANVEESAYKMNMGNDLKDNSTSRSSDVVMNAATATLPTKTEKRVIKVKKSNYKVAKPIPADKMA